LFTMTAFLGGTTMARLDERGNGGTLLAFVAGGILVLIAVTGWAVFTGRAPVIASRDVELRLPTAPKLPPVPTAPNPEPLPLPGPGRPG
jgi:hypothetical protein